MTILDTRAVLERNAAVAAQLRAERIKQGLTQPALAVECHLGVSQICGWENGKTPGMTNLNRWAAGLGLEITAVRRSDQDAAVRAVDRAIRTLTLVWSGEAPFEDIATARAELIKHFEVPIAQLDADEPGARDTTAEADQ